MKARVKATGKEFKVRGILTPTADAYAIEEVNLFFDESDQVELLHREDYWTRLEHQYAGMAMQGMLSNAVGFDEVRKGAADNGIDNLIVLIAGASIDYATTLVEKLKEKEERK